MTEDRAATSGDDQIYEFTATDRTADDLGRAVVKYRLGSVAFALGNVVLLALAVVFAVQGVVWLGAIILIFVFVSVAGLLRRAPRLAEQFRQRGFVEGQTVVADYGPQILTIRTAAGTSHHRYDSVRSLRRVGPVVALRTGGGVLVVLPAELVPDAEAHRFT